jgi:cytochrome P450
MDDTLASAVATPRSRASLATGQALPALAARIGARLAAFFGKPFKFGTIVIAARHEDVRAVLARDLDFIIAPINAARIDTVNGPFVLGMDRGPALEVERRALYSALAAVDQDALRHAAQVDADALLDGAVACDALGGYARIVAGRTAMRLFGIRPADEPLYLDVVRAIFAHTFLNLGGDAVIEARAVKAAGAMRAWFTDEIAARRASGKFGTDMMGGLLAQGMLDDDGVRRTLGGMLVGSIDTTSGCVARILTVVAKDHHLRTAMLAARSDATLYAYCLEALRRWPHNPIVMRQAAAATVLAGRVIAAGDKIFVWTQAAMQDRAMFPEPSRMRPDRDPRGYVHFGGALHVCAGRDGNSWQIPLLIRALLARDFKRDGTMLWAGPFPDVLPIRLGGAQS